MIIAAFIGAGIMLRVFDAFIVGASALGGAGLSMDGAHLIFQSLGILDRTTIVNGAVTPLIIWLVLGAIAIGWQFKNLEKWTKKSRHPMAMAPKTDQMINGVTVPFTIVVRSRMPKG